MSTCIHCGGHFVSYTRLWSTVPHEMGYKFIYTTRCTKCGAAGDADIWAHRDKKYQRFAYVARFAQMLPIADPCVHTIHGVLLK